MTQSVKNLIHLTPRAISFMFVAFLSLFSLDVFSSGQGFWQILGGLFMHLIPVFVIIGVIIISWNRQWIASIFFLVIGLLHAYLTYSSRETRRPGSGFDSDLGAYLMIGGSCVLLSILFYLSWKYRNTNTQG